MSPRKITSIIEIQFSLYKKSFPYAAPEIGFVFFSKLCCKKMHWWRSLSLKMDWWQQLAFLETYLKKSFAGGRQLARRSNMTGINPSTACTYMSSFKVDLYNTQARIQDFSQRGVRFDKISLHARAH